jgi:hypothetical protein
MIGTVEAGQKLKQEDNISINFNKSSSLVFKFIHHNYELKNHASSKR